MNSKNLLMMASVLIAGLTIGYLLPDHATSSNEERVDRDDGPCPGGGEPLAWRNPMNPAVTSPVFTRDEMGMDYLPVCADGVSRPGGAGSVTIDPTMAQNIGVRTVVAEQKTISRDIRTVGRVTMDEQRVARLHPKVEGWVEKLFIDRTGEQVGKNTMLLAIYSPQLVASGEEYLLALRNWQKLKNSPFTDIREGAKRLLSTSLERLKLLDVPEHQLKEIRTTGRVPKALHIHSPFDGIVMNIGVREGQRITPETELYMVADLTRVWVQVDVYEDELPWVRLGDEAEMRLSAAPGRVFKGKLSYIYPYLDGKTRTNKVRIEFANPDLALKPEMFANVTLKPSRTVNAVVVPSEAIVRTGMRNQVFVQRSEGRFEPRIVELGLQSDGGVQILSGIKEGEAVVTSSQFLIDSESKLKEATAKMLSIGASSSDSQVEAVPEASMDGGHQHMIHSHSPDEKPEAGAHAPAEGHMQMHHQTGEMP
ncbi:membrane fusion protein, Cu(I)/Ag(I) efflux system [Mariprofundus ferrinatatus]|uniref:Membrane fusion protein, Cu(I)/Ag(I) efflux system n=1 Tax=Mariprofundus ferrinatatus TaxID=1921087 RepID=A0A2K8L403_9PROT|nr:efflux RND transporter periplasmic adaptor subunit [Mariprofundus ferrinatatus]ATX80959.1 membrane fusion protein, Cu(I)/Ag(I) efflux system [Mariprofundus ferrinatatus]